MRLLKLQSALVITGVMNIYAVAFEVLASDDSEESFLLGIVDPTSSDLEFGFDSHLNKGQQLSCMKFDNILVPRGASIAQAKLSFVAKTSDSDAISLECYGEKSPSPTGFSETNLDISLRTFTQTKVPWLPEPWIIDLNFDTPDLSNVVEEIVAQDGWISGNSLVLCCSNQDMTTSSTNRRRSHSIDRGDGSTAARLTVDINDGITPSSSPTQKPTSAPTPVVVSTQAPVPSPSSSPVPNPTPVPVSSPEGSPDNNNDSEEPSSASAEESEATIFGLPQEIVIAGGAGSIFLLGTLFFICSGPTNRGPPPPYPMGPGPMHQPGPYYHNGPRPGANAYYY